MWSDGGQGPAARRRGKADDLMIVEVSAVQGGDAGTLEGIDAGAGVCAYLCHMRTRGRFLVRDAEHCTISSRRRTLQVRGWYVRESVGRAQVWVS